MIKQSEVRRSGEETVNLHVATHVSGFQADTLERDAFEALRPVRSMKNSLAPINRVPPEILSLIPDYCCEDDMDQDLVALTHVRRSWRDTLISRSSLWTKLDFIDTDKTRTYIQRSRSSPFELYLRDDEVMVHAFPLIIPHIQRLKPLTVDARDLPSALRHFRCHVPLLRELDISVSTGIDPVLDSASSMVISHRSTSCTCLESLQIFPGKIYQTSELSTSKCFPNHTEQLKFWISSSPHPSYTRFRFCIQWKTHPTLHPSE
jgi:hypothetical protein